MKTCKTIHDKNICWPVKIFAPAVPLAADDVGDAAVVVGVGEVGPVAEVLGPAPAHTQA